MAFLIIILATLGIILVYSGVTGQSVRDMLQGLRGAGSGSRSGGSF